MTQSLEMIANIVPVEIRRLPGQDDLPLPQYQSDHAAGMDLCAAVPTDQTITIPPYCQNPAGAIALIPCGIAIAVPVGFEAQIRPRSGLATKFGISIPNSPGTIDADYRGEIRVAIINLGSQPFVVTRGMRIAQMVIAPVVRAQWREVRELSETVRGAGGFGHTGH